MRIKPSASFPHPVLAASTEDYGDRTFQLSLSVKEAAAEGSVILEGNMDLDDPSIMRLIESGKASSGLMITCLDTYLDRFERCPLGEVKLDLSGGQVRGLVYVRGVVVATHDGLALESEAINTEFLPEARTVNGGDYLALTQELSFEAGLEKLAPLESIFRLKIQEDVPEGQFVLDLESESVDILVSPALHHFLSLLRKQPMKDTLLSALYLPVVMAVLEALGEEGYADKRWYGVMSARCNAEGIDIKHADLARSAQKLLDSPLGALKKAFERMTQ